MKMKKKSFLVHISIAAESNEKQNVSQIIRNRLPNTFRQQNGYSDCCRSN